LYQVFEDAASLVLRYSPNAFEAAHQEEAAWLSDTGDMCCWTAAHASSENYDILFFNPEHLVDVVVDVDAVIQNIFFVGLKYIFAVWLIHIVPTRVKLLRLLK
jgi:hypothetical protein